MVVTLSFLNVIGTALNILNALNLLNSKQSLIYNYKILKLMREGSRIPIHKIK